MMSMVAVGFRASWEAADASDIAIQRVGKPATPLTSEPRANEARRQLVRSRLRGPTRLVSIAWKPRANAGLSSRSR